MGRVDMPKKFLHIAAYVV